jgi:CRISPR-associated endonuclease/helicase Cas3
VTAAEAPPLTAADFSAFCQQAHGYRPFPWQQDLAGLLLDGGRWPDMVDVPTGLGKTSLIDIAVFAAAARPRASWRRVFFVVDRRLVVDEAFEHAKRLQKALHTGAGGICAWVAGVLRQDGDDPNTPVLEVTRMRGGLTWSWRWLDRPDRHAVVVGTIDQVGSRLLFRGYGVGEQLRPIDAALTGRDSLIIVDEAHLAGPFTQTLRDATGGPAAARRAPLAPGQRAI